MEPETKRIGRFIVERASRYSTELVGSKYDKEILVPETKVLKGLFSRSEKETKHISRRYVPKTLMGVPIKGPDFDKFLAKPILEQLEEEFELHPRVKEDLGNVFLNPTRRSNLLGEVTEDYYTGQSQIHLLPNMILESSSHRGFSVSSRSDLYSERAKAVTSHEFGHAIHGAYGNALGFDFANDTYGLDHQKDLIQELLGGEHPVDFSEIGNHIYNAAKKIDSKYAATNFLELIAEGYAAKQHGGNPFIDPALKKMEAVIQNAPTLERLQRVPIAPIEKRELPKTRTSSARIARAKYQLRS